MSDKPTTSIPEASIRSWRWRFAALGVMLLLITGFTYFHSPSALERAVVKAGGTFKVHRLNRSPLQVLSEILNRAARQPPAHYISFEDVPVDDNWLREHRGDLSNSTNVSLSLVDTQVTDAGIAELRDMANIDALCLQGSLITDASLPVITSLPNAVVLNVAQTSISGDNFGQLSAMTSLSHLTIDGHQAVNGGMASLQPMPRLQSLYIADATNEGISAVVKSGNRQIFYMVFKGHEVTDESLADLSTLQTAKIVTLVDTQLSGKAIKSLKAALPNCDVHIYTTEQLEDVMAATENQ